MMLPLPKDSKREISCGPVTGVIQAKNRITFPPNIAARRVWRVVLGAGRLEAGLVARDPLAARGSLRITTSRCVSAPYGPWTKNPVFLLQLSQARYVPCFERPIFVRL